MKILVTGFDPFDNDKINPAIEAVKLLPDSIAGAEIIKLEIPTKFNVSAEVVKTAIEKYQPDYVLNIGQAGGRFAITPERIAINLDDGRIADNAGYQPLNATIHEDGATAYFTQLPIKAMTLVLSEQRGCQQQFLTLPALMSATTFFIKSNICVRNSSLTSKPDLSISHFYLIKLLRDLRHLPFLLKMMLKA